MTINDETAKRMFPNTAPSTEQRYPHPVSEYLPEDQEAELAFRLLTRTGRHMPAPDYNRAVVPAPVKDPLAVKLFPITR